MGREKFVRKPVKKEAAKALFERIEASRTTSSGTKRAKHDELEEKLEKKNKSE